jgi:hypothetical protein
MNKRTSTALIALLVISLGATGFAKKKKDDPLATLNFVVVRDENGKPVRNAAVIMHPVDEDGKQTRQGLELKTNPEGKASYDGVPYGRIRVQVLAQGFQTYGDDVQVGEPSMDVMIKLKRPARQYSIYEDHPPEKKKDDTKQEKKEDPGQ